MSGNGTVEYPECFELGESEKRAPKCSFLGDLPSGVVLTGTPTVTEIGTSDLTVADVQLNTAALTLKGMTHAIGTVVIFTVTGAKAGRMYKIRVRAQTNGSPSENPERIVAVVGVADGT
ncbi:MAG: hypothetical protein ACPGVG_13280 [Mycobacterium sp.]